MEESNINMKDEEKEKEKDKDNYKTVKATNLLQKTKIYLIW